MIQRLWFSNNPVVWLFAPLTLLFWALSALRRLLFKLGVKQRKHPGIPVVVVGNITVGGNGKTPTVIYLVNLCREAGLKPGVLSRGYGGSQDAFPHLIGPDCTASLTGDEPYLIYQRLKCPVVIDPVRTRGAEHLKQQGVDVIICDDGLQHYALARDVEIIVIDSKNRFGNGHLLPMGPLREGTWRLQQADFLIANGTGQSGEESMTLLPGKLINLLDSDRTLAVEAIQGDVSALAGIGYPQRFFDTLTELGISCSSQLAFADHHNFSAADIPDGTVLMTEKDAVKCREFAHADCWYLPVDAQLSADFDAAFIEKVKHYGT